MSSATRKLIDFVLALDATQVSAEVSRQARRCVLDLLGVALAGSRTRMAQVSARWAFQQFKAGDATVIGSLRELSPAGAAWINGISATVLDLDDGHRLAIGHPGTSVIPTALAVAEATGANGEALLLAIVAGYELAVRVSKARKPRFKERQYATGIWGSFGAVAAAAKLLDVDVDTFQHAIGINLAHGPFPPSGAYAYESMIKEGIGWSGMAGCAAALLAQQGFEGPRDALDQSGRYEIHQLIDGLETDCAILGTYFKPHASCRWSHPAIDGVLKLLDQHRVETHEVERVRIEGFYEVTRLVDYAPSTTIGAQFSIPFCVALALLYKRVGPAELSEANLRNPQVLDLAHKVEVEKDPELDRRFPEQTVTRVTLCTNRGNFTTLVEYPKGNPENPMSDAELVEKFRSLAVDVAGEERAVAVERAVDRLDQMEDVRDLTEHLAFGQR